MMPLLIVTGVAVAGFVGFKALQYASPPAKPGRSERAEAAPAKAEVELSETQLRSVTIGSVVEQSFDDVRQAVGSIDFNQNMLVQAFTPYQGRIKEVFVNVGDRVLQGQVLFTVDSADLLQASSTLISAAGVLTLQNRTLRRVGEVFKAGGGPQKDIDQATSDQQAAEGALRAARDTMHIYGKSEQDVDRIIADRRADSTLVVRSPITGYVTARTAAPGLFVQPGNAPAPVTLADTTTMWMIANVPESDSALLRVGQPVSARVSAMPGEQFRGNIVVVGASVDAQTRRVAVRSEIADPKQLLRAGMFATFSIRVSEPVRATAVPSNTVVREGDGSMTVWTTTDRRHFEQRVVKAGSQQGGFTRITDGLQPGELIVTDGAIFLSNKLSGGATD